MRVRDLAGGRPGVGGARRRGGALTRALGSARLDSRRRSRRASRPPAGERPRARRAMRRSGRSIVRIFLSRSLVSSVTGACGGEGLGGTFVVTLFYTPPEGERPVPDPRNGHPRRGRMSNETPLVSKYAALPPPFSNSRAAKLGEPQRTSYFFGVGTGDTGALRSLRTCDESEKGRRSDRVAPGFSSGSTGATPRSTCPLESSLHRTQGDWGRNPLLRRT